MNSSRFPLFWRRVTWLLLWMLLSKIVGPVWADDALAWLCNWIRDSTHIGFGPD